MTDKNVFMWKGQVVDEMSHSELLAVVKDLGRLYADSLQDHIDRSRMFGVLLKARRANTGPKPNDKPR